MLQQHASGEGGKVLSVVQRQQLPPLQRQCSALLATRGQVQVRCCWADVEGGF